MAVMKKDKVGDGSDVTAVTAVHFRGDIKE